LENAHDAAREARNVAMERVADRANRCDNWTARAYTMLGGLCILCIISKRGTLGEDIRSKAYEHGLDRPPDERAWGPVFARAKRDGILRRVGFGKAKTSHLSPKSLWARAA